jgi:4-amino-4-deoxy-L-arabinose transferase-like glycosyltransferase
VSPALPTTSETDRESARQRPADRWLPWALFGLVSLMLFYRLGASALFEPDEGRNAEKAREILLLNDWITPHENFHAVLDKPMFFYWLIALSFNLFGVSEWAARLPSALAGLGCILVVYFSVRRWWGEWEARWSVLILGTSAGFFIFSRIVIFDLTLTTFITLAMWAFYQAAHEPTPTAGWGSCALLYIALGAATLTKGLVGLVVPGMIFFSYLLLSNSWRILGRIRLLPGVVLFLLVVAPWYVLAEMHNPGYLRYYLWEEHFGRFATTKFDRFNPWYFYLYVVPIGLLPWTFLLPAAVKNYWRRRPDDRTLWLILWAVLPILFFSLSKAKLPHYILPSFPALAVLIGVALPRAMSEFPGWCRFGFGAGWLSLSSLFIYSIAGVIRPEIFPEIVRGRFDSITILFAASAAIFLLLVFLTSKRTLWAEVKPKYVLFGQAAGLLIFVGTLAEMMVLVAPAKSAKEIAAKALPLLSPTTQMVTFDTYAEGLAFYLKTEKPLWVVTHSKKKRTFLGNFYAITGQPDPISPLGKGLLTFEEFRDIWKGSDMPLVILIKEKNLRGLERLVGAGLKRAAANDDYLIVTRP